MAPNMEIYSLSSGSWGDTIGAKEKATAKEIKPGAKDQTGEKVPSSAL